MKTRKWTMMVVVLAAVAVSNASFGALSQVLMSENFDSMIPNASLTSQDSSWSYVANNGGKAVYQYVTGSDAGWPLSSNQGAVLGGVFPNDGSSSVVVTKTLSATPTKNNVEYELNMYANYLQSAGLYHGNHVWLNIAKADGTAIAQMNFYREYDTPNFDLNGVAFTAPPAAFSKYVIDLNFATQTATISIDGVDQGVVASFLTAANPQDVVTLNFKTGGYYSGNNKEFYMCVDNLVVSQVPEPVTVSLLLLGGLGVLRRKH